MPRKQGARLSFPGDLAAQVGEMWAQLIAGDYSPPALPNQPQLRELLEVAYFAGMETDESRPLRFMVCCTPNSDPIGRQGDARPLESWEFASPRPFNIQEIRRLAAVSDLDSSAIWIRFTDDSAEQLEIRGLVNLGRSWSVARNAFAYHYDPLPHALLVRVIAPGRMVIYQGNYCIATLAAGKLEVGAMRMPALDLLGANSLFKEGHEALRQLIAAPSHEPPKEWHEFEWLAYVNCILAVVNGMQLTGHGGALILKSIRCDPVRMELIRIKYGLGDGRDHLKKRFVEFMNSRHKQRDMVWRSEWQKESAPNREEIELAFFRLRDVYQQLARTCSFVSELARTDGAVVLNTDLTIEGFGTEIVLDKVKPAKPYPCSWNLKIRHFWLANVRRERAGGQLHCSWALARAVCPKAFATTYVPRAAPRA